MNDRIKELIEQATTVEKGPMVFGPNPYNSEIVTFDKEKFAELILRECISTIRADYVNNGTTAAVLAIESHFGITE